MPYKSHIKVGFSCQTDASKWRSNHWDVLGNLFKVITVFFPPIPNTVLSLIFQNVEWPNLDSHFNSYSSNRSYEVSYRKRTWNSLWEKKIGDVKRKRWVWNIQLMSIFQFVELEVRFDSDTSLYGPTRRRLYTFQPQA